MQTQRERMDAAGASYTTPQKTIGGASERASPLCATVPSAPPCGVMVGLLDWPAGYGAPQDPYAGAAGAASPVCWRKTSGLAEKEPTVAPRGGTNAPRLRARGGRARRGARLEALEGIYGAPLRELPPSHSRELLGKYREADRSPYREADRSRAAPVADDDMPLALRRPRQHLAWDVDASTVPLSQYARARAAPSQHVPNSLVSDGMPRWRK